jgi:hypothetical protein
VPYSTKDTDLTVSCTSDNGTQNSTAGKVDGKKITWTTKSEYNGSPLTINYEGKLDSDKIVGSVTVVEFSVEGDFTATPVK